MIFSAKLWFLSQKYENAEFIPKFEENVQYRPKLVVACTYVMYVWGWKHFYTSPEYGLTAIAGGNVRQNKKSKKLLSSIFDD